ncbi:FAD:protein FMN transferase, partial [Acinetobacter sp. 163]|nr:FAD:protein FMN transferase [Acinetobacter sp. 163]
LCDSDICRAHAASPEAVDVSPETAELVRTALGYCERSRGTFDITMGTLTRLWDFHRGVVPSPLALSRALPHVWCAHIEMGGSDASPTLAIDDPETVL